MSTPNLTLFDVPHSLARHSDPATSHTAALRQRGGLSEPILAAFGHWGPMTDDELASRVEGYAASIKTCRSRLAKADLLVATDQVRLSARGCPQIVWRLP